MILKMVTVFGLLKAEQLQLRAQMKIKMHNNIHKKCEKFKWAMFANKTALLVKVKPVQLLKLAFNKIMNKQDHTFNVIALLNDGLNVVANKILYLALNINPALDIPKLFDMLLAKLPQVALSALIHSAIIIIINALLVLATMDIAAVLHQLLQFKLVNHVHLVVFHKSFKFVAPGVECPTVPVTVDTVPLVTNVSNLLTCVAQASDKLVLHALVIVLLLEAVWMDVVALDIHVMFKVILAALIQQSVLMELKLLVHVLTIFAVLDSLVPTIFAAPQLLLPPVVLMEVQPLVLVSAVDAVPDSHVQPATFAAHQLLLYALLVKHLLEFV
jgi:hypothetical protein